MESNRGKYSTISGKTGCSKRKYYENLLSEICNLFDIDKFKENKKLDGLYLLGFHSQEYDLRFKKKIQKRRKRRNRHE